MVPKKIFQSLVFALPLCVVGFAVLMGGAALTRAMNDMLGARVLTWGATAILLLGVADAILLLCALGLQALYERDEPPAHDRSRDARSSDRSALPGSGPEQE